MSGRTVAVSVPPVAGLLFSAGAREHLAQGRCRMSALEFKSGRTHVEHLLSALPPKADIDWHPIDVRFVP
jgi:hypothetical protein